MIESKMNCNIPLKTPEHIEKAVATLTATGKTKWQKHRTRENKGLLYVHINYGGQAGIYLTGKLVFPMNNVTYELRW